MSSQVDYRAIAGAIISAPKPAPRRSARKTSTERLDFNHEPVKGEDEFLPGYFPEETFIAHLESSVSVEKGEYNVLVRLIITQKGSIVQANDLVRLQLYKPDPDPPSSFVEPTFLLSTNGWHPESEALRPAFLIHSYRLLLAVEEVLAAASSDAGDKKREVVAIYDCGEDSWVVEGHKSIRFYVIRANTTSECSVYLLDSKLSSLKIGRSIRV